MTEQEFEKAKRINKDIQKLFDRVKEKIFKVKQEKLISFTRRLWISQQN